MNTTELVILAIAVLALLMVLALAIRIVPEYQRLVVLRLGRVIGVKGPGLVLLIPLVDRGIRVDLRETYFDVPPQTTITMDNANVSIDFLVYSKVVDALPSVLNVEDYEGASRGIAITTLRAVVGSMSLDDVLAKREEINWRSARSSTRSPTGGASRSPRSRSARSPRRARSWRR